MPAPHRFVNVSPTDGNVDETQNSLQYATRVRTIKARAGRAGQGQAGQGWVLASAHTHLQHPFAVCVAQYCSHVSYVLTLATHYVLQNDATRNEANKEVVRLKKQIDYWKDQAALPPSRREYVDLVEIMDQKQSGVWGSGAYIEGSQPGAMPLSRECIHVGGH